MEALAIPVGAPSVSKILFGIFFVTIGQNPFEVYQSIYNGAFGSWFSWQNMLQRTSALMLVPCARRCRRGAPDRVGAVHDG